MRKIKRDGREWSRRMHGLVETYLDLKQCGICGSPRHNGYLCWFCGLDDGVAEDYPKSRRPSREEV